MLTNDACGRLGGCLFGLVALALAPSCSGTASNDDDGQGGGGNAAANSGGAGGLGGSGSSALTGSFQVSLVAAELGVPKFTKIIGRVFDAPPPNALLLTVAQEEGGCQLLVPEAPFCSPACGGAAVCTSENLCTPNATPQDVGPVSFTGLTNSELVLTSTPPVFIYQSAAALPSPPCMEGSVVELRAEDFTIQAKCIGELRLTGPDPVPVLAGKAVDLDWSPPAQSGISQIQVHLDISHHGGKKGEINCNVPDTGAFSIPESLVTRLIGLGVAGYPRIGLSRVSSAASTARPNIKLELDSVVERDVDTGFESCASDQDCAGGALCDTRIFICK